MPDQALREHLGDLQDPVHFAELLEADAAWREGLDRIALLACNLLRVPVAQVNVVLDDEQLSVASVARSVEHASWEGPRRVAVEASFCRQVARTGEPMVVGNALVDPRVRNIPSTGADVIHSYAAVPLKNAEGRTLATLCAFDFEPREWELENVVTLATLADVLAREIRGRIQAESALQQGEARFRALIEQGADLITVLDREGTILYASPAYARILGYGEEDLQGRRFAELMHPRDVGAWHDAFLEAPDEPAGRTFAEWRMRHADGSWRTVEGRGSNLLDDPAVRGIVLNVIDVTKERRTQLELQQAQKMEAVGRLAGGVAHDFNNLLTAIEGNASFLMERDDLPPDALADVREMAEAAKRASALTAQLLSFARRQVLDVSTVCLGEVVDGIVPLVKRLLGPNVRLRAELGRGLPVMADAGQLGQVIMNLAVNARDAMPNGGTLTLETRTVEVGEEQEGSHDVIRSGRYAQLVVADDGEGMTRRVLRKIFDPFYTTKEKGKGTGLGLSIAWGVVDQMGGHIHVYSEPGEGTAFRIYFPLQEAPARSNGGGGPRRNGGRHQVGGLAREGAGGGAGRTTTLLVVEDQPEVRRVMTRILEGQGHRVLAVDSAEAALELESNGEGTPDLVLTDVSLPGMTGPEMAGHLADRWPGVRIVFTSGFTRDELLNQDVKLGGSGFLPKPFGPSELSSVVKEALGA